jgi:alkaline phosphatase
MAHYQIINNHDTLKEFIEWLPELNQNEKYYVCLFARKKYCANVKYIKTDKSQCKRFLAHKKNLYDSIRQLEVPIGSYNIKGIEIPQEALALYISVNPRCMLRGTRQSLIKFANMLALEYNGYNPVAECLSEVHKSVSRKVWFDMDFDGMDFSQIEEQVYDSVNEDAVRVLKTRGGFHLLVELGRIDEEHRTRWYQKLSKIEGCDVKGDNLLPVVGCVQGNFTPYFINRRT